MAADNDYRIEKDSMGELKVPTDALWGAQSQRAVDNFPISDLRAPRAMINALGLIKASAADVNRDLELLDGDIAQSLGHILKDRHVAGQPIVGRVEYLAIRVVSPFGQSDQPVQSLRESEVVFRTS